MITGNAEIIQIDYTKKRKGWLTDGGGEIDYCPQCGRKGEISPEGITPAGTKAFQGFVFHKGLLDRTNNMIEMTDCCDLPLSPEAEVIIKWRTESGWDELERG